ncbi:MAG: methyltransferase domain-containing protein, partial [Epsilonproteobacteria bacterium]|nr:methyltransferase domain-containing protein [Campylobacterota bacterium]
LGFEEATNALYDLFIERLTEERPESLLDIGCGSGAFLKRVLTALELKRVEGIDLSEEMVRRAVAAGVPARAVDVCDAEGTFEAATAVFDVLNYLDAEGLRRFMGCVRRHLAPGGLFLADVNTYFGFEAVGQGALIRRDETALLAMESLFDGERMETVIDLFAKTEAECYKRESDTVVQYYHDPARFEEFDGWRLEEIVPVMLYDEEEADKWLLVFRAV